MIPAFWGRPSLTSAYSFWEVTPRRCSRHLSSNIRMGCIKMSYYTKSRFFKMYALVKFNDDNVYYACSLNNLKKRGRLVFGKYGKNYYAAELICTNGNKQTLVDISSKLNMGGLYIDLSESRLNEQNMNVVNEEMVCTINSNGGLSENMLEDGFIYEDQGGQNDNLVNMENSEDTPKVVREAYTDR